MNRKLSKKKLDSIVRECLNYEMSREIDYENYAGFQDEEEWREEVDSFHINNINTESYKNYLLETYFLIKSEVEYIIKELINAICEWAY